MKEESKTLVKRLDLNDSSTEEKSNNYSKDSHKLSKKYPVVVLNNLIKSERSDRSDEDSSN